MSRMAAICSISVAIALAAAGGVTNVRAQQYSLDGVLIGKWHQEYGPYVSETVFTAGHEFMTVTIQRGAPYRLYIQGRWEVRYGNQLWQHNLHWVPDNIRVAEWEGTQFRSSTRIICGTSSATCSAFASGNNL
jgi:hypothetical protein